jgi:hypothetical protein
VLEVGDDLDGRAPLVSMREGGKEGSWRTGGPWACCWTGPRGGVKKERGLDGLGRKEEKRERKKEKREWARPKEKRREKKNCIQMHLNLNLKFEFKWKTNSKTMQCGMKCAKPIFSYVSFYS